MMLAPSSSSGLHFHRKVDKYGDTVSLAELCPGPPGEGVSIWLHDDLPDGNIARQEIALTDTEADVLTIGLLQYHLGMNHLQDAGMVAAIKDGEWK